MIKPPKGLGVFAWRRLVLTIVLMLFINGVLKWFSTPQEEDPQLPPRDGIVTVLAPGVIASDAERLITKPLEDELAHVEEIKDIRSTIRTHLIFMQIKLKNEVAANETDAAWDKIQRALDRASLRFPESAQKPVLNRDVYDQDAVFIALYGGKDPLALLDHTRELKDRLQLLPLVKAIDIVGSPGEQLTVLMDSEKLGRLGVSLDSFVKQLKGGNASVPSGQVLLQDQKISVVTNSFYKSPEELSKFPIHLRSGEIVPLSEVATISRTPTLPAYQGMRFNGEIAIGIGVVPKKHVNLQIFGSDVREVIERFQKEEAFQKSGLKIEEISFQPHYVAERVHEIGLDLVKAIFLVGGLLVLMMGLRAGSIVAMQVPLVTVIAFGIFAWTGGVVNQISIAAFILAIGLLVDNVVVIVDGIQSKLDQGLSPIEAGEQTRKEYLVPLLAGTITTIAAFLPMLISKGTTADFTRAIGVISAVGLGCSYIFCIFATPLISASLLRKGKTVHWHFVEPLGEKLGNLVNRHAKVIALSAFIAVIAAMLGFTFVKKQFFPFADRDLLIVDIRLPEGTNYQKTFDAVKRVEEVTLKDSRIASVTSVIGRGVPPFYYNLPREPNSLNIAQLIVRTKSRKDAVSFKVEKQEQLQNVVPFATLIVRDIAQGPVVKAPIEVRIFSDDPKKLQEASEKAFSLVKEAPGAWKWRTTLGLGLLEYQMNVDDAAAGTYGLTRAEVSAIVLAQTSGIPISTFRGGDDPYSINLLSKQNEHSTFEDIRGAYLSSTRSENLSVNALVNESVKFGPTQLNHFNREPVVYLYAEISPKSSENKATSEVKELMKNLPQIEGVKYELAGALKESSDAQKLIFSALPVALFILLISLMFEFNSFRRVGIILLTVPLCVVGSVPGLLITGSAFGFMTLLGLFALAGTVIHNGIFLIDYIDHRMHDDHVPIDQAITEGIQRRTRPIILTAAATIIELLPMTLSSSTLWPPFAWVIISGLLVSTLMTLLVIPSVFKLAFSKEAHS